MFLRTPSEQYGIAQCIVPNDCTFYWKIQGADKSLARPGRKQANVSVRMA